MSPYDSSINDDIEDREKMKLSVYAESALSALTEAERIQYPQDAINADLDCAVSNAELDDPEFDAISTLNSMLPNTSALHTIDSNIEKLQKQFDVVGKSLTSSIQSAAFKGQRSSNALSNASNAVNELFSKVSSIKSKASESEKLVHEMSADIRILDTAKTNLTATITALKRLHMLSKAVEQLRSATQTRSFVRAASLIEAVQSLDDHFQHMHNVPALKVVRKKASDCRDSLRSAVFECFGAAHHAGSNSSDEASPAIVQLREACEVVQVLGAECKVELISSVVRRQLEPYRVVFAPSDGLGGIQADDASFESAEKRFSWLRRQMKNFAIRFGRVFPLSWNVPGELCSQFCHQTARDLGVLLQRSEHGKKIDATVFVRVLTSTIHFEGELDEFYSRPSDGLQRYYDDDPDKFEQQGEYGSAEAIRRKYRGVKNKEKWSQRVDDERVRIRRENIYVRADNESESSTAEDTTRHKQFKNAISECFYPFMSSYVSLERSNMNELLTHIENSEDWTCLSTHSLTRFKGSDELFLYIKRSMKRLSQLDVVNEIGVSLQAEYQNALINLAHLLKQHIPIASETSNTLSSPVVLTQQQVKALAVLVNTAEYCSETLPHLQDSIHKMLGNDAVNEISLDEAQDQFDALINAAIASVVLSCLTQVETAMAMMNRLSLDTLDTVGDTSAYIGEARSALTISVSTFSALVSPDYHHYLCSKLVLGVMQKFMLTITRLKKLGDMGAQQLLLDAEALKSVLLSLPSLGTDEQEEAEKRKKRAPKTFAPLLIKQVAKVESILKTVSHPPDALANAFAALLPNGAASDLAKIMELKGGMKKQDMQNVLKAYTTQTPASEQNAPILQPEEASATSRKYYLFR